MGRIVSILHLSVRGASNPLQARRPPGAIIVTLGSQAVKETSSKALYTFSGSYLRSSYGSMWAFALVRPGFMCHQPAENVKNRRRGPLWAVIVTLGGQAIEETFAQALNAFFMTYLMRWNAFTLYFVPSKGRENITQSSQNPRFFGAVDPWEKVVGDKSYRRKSRQFYCSHCPYNSRG